MEFNSEEKEIMQEALVVFYEDALDKNHSGLYDRETELLNEVLGKIGYERISI